MQLSKGVKVKGDNIGDRIDRSAVYERELRKGRIRPAAVLAAPKNPPDAIATGLLLQDYKRI